MRTTLPLNPARCRPLPATELAAVQAAGAAPSLLLNPALRPPPLPWRVPLPTLPLPH